MGKVDILAMLKQQKQQQQEAKEKSGGLRTRKIALGDNLVRLLPAEDGGLPFRQYGQHFVKSDDGKISVYPCQYQISEGQEECPICVAIFEGLSMHKGNKVMEDKINKMKAAKRFLWNGIFMEDEDDTGGEVEVIELSTTAFEACRDRWIEHLEEEIGDPLDLKDGYPFKITRTGSGIDTVYTATPRKKLRDAHDLTLPNKTLEKCVDLDAFIQESDDKKLLTVLNKANQVMALPPVSSLAAIGFSSDSAEPTKPAKPTHRAEKSLTERELGDDETEYKPTPIPKDVQKEEGDDDIPFDGAGDNVSTDDDLDGDLDALLKELED